jgi:hypothetical protein
MKNSALKAAFLLSLVSAVALGTSSVNAETRISVSDRVGTVNADGTKESGFGLVSSIRLGVGTYDLRWGRNITRCAAVITMGSGTSFGAAVGIGTAVQRAGSAAKGHFVQIFDAAGALADREFMIYVGCP